MRFTTTRRNAVMAISALSIGALVLTGCSGSAATEGEKAAEGRGSATETTKATEFIVATGYDMGAGFDPATTTGALPLGVNAHTYEGLIELDPVTRKPFLALAKEEPKKIDDTHYEVTLRDGAKFSDGTPVTADDVVFSYNRLMDPNFKEAAVYQGFISFLDKVEKKDDTTVTFTLKFPFSLLNERLSVVKIIEKSVYEGKPAEELAKCPVGGSGPYKAESASDCVPGSHVTLVKNENYNGPKPAAAPKATWKVLDDENRVTAMKSGTVQAIENVPDLIVSQNGLGDKVKVESVQSFGVMFMMFNTKKAPFDKKEVRQAFLYAVNTPKIIDGVFYGNAEQATSYLQSTHPDYQKAATQFDYNVDKAKELLAAAGVSNLTVKLRATDTGFVKSSVPMIQNDLAAIGVTANLEVAESKATYEAVDSGDFDVLVAPGDPSVFGNDPDILLRWWYGDNVWTKTRMQWADTPEFQQLLALEDRAVRESGDAQKATWKEAFDMIADQAALYPLVHRKISGAWNPEVLEGYAPLPITGISVLDVKLK